MNMHTDASFAEMSIPDFLDVIPEGGARADEAMYFLLHQRLLNQLRKRYEIYQRQLQDEYKDVVEDFFLYICVRARAAGVRHLTSRCSASLRRNLSMKTFYLNKLVDLQ